jgi:hypothetical protein
MGMLHYEHEIKLDSNPVELADLTFKCLCLILGHLNTMLEPFGSSSSIIQLHYDIMFITRHACIYNHNLNVFTNVAITTPQ